MSVPAEVTGTVRDTLGEPVAGVLVMGLDLNYAETDATGRFRLARPEMALLFWSTGYRPAALRLDGREPHVDMVLRNT